MKLSKSSKMVLIVAFFPGSIRYEGIRRVALSAYDRFANEKKKPTLLVPYKGDVPDSYSSFFLSENKGFSKIISALILYLRMLATIYKSKDLYDEFYCIESNPASAFTTIFLRLICRKQNSSVFFLSPIIEFNTFLKVFLTYKDFQMPLHYLFGNRLLAIFCRLFLSDTGRYYVGSDYQKEQLLKLGLDSKVIDTYGAVSPKSKNRKKSGPIVIGYLGHFSTIKGVDVLISCFKEVLDLGFDVHLSIAWSGKGNCSDRISSLLSPDVFPSDRLTVTGIVEPESFFQKIDLLVLPYLATSVPIPPAVLYEAVSSGTEVLIPDLPGLSGTLGKYCRFYKSESRLSLVNKIVDFLNE